MNQTNNNTQAKRHMKSFWPLALIFVIAVLFGIAIYWFQFNLVTDYDLQSIALTVRARPHGAILPVKSPAKTKNTSTATTTVIK
jgi:hypothetical protein